MPKSLFPFVWSDLPPAATPGPRGARMDLIRTSGKERGHKWIIVKHRLAAIVHFSIWNQAQPEPTFTLAEWVTALLQLWVGFAFLLSWKGKTSILSLKSRAYPPLQKWGCQEKKRILDLEAPHLADSPWDGTNYCILWLFGTTYYILWEQCFRLNEDHFS